MILGGESKGGDELAKAIAEVDGKVASGILRRAIAKCAKIRMQAYKNHVPHKSGKTLESISIVTPRKKKRGVIARLVQIKDEIYFYWGFANYGHYAGKKNTVSATRKERTFVDGLHWMEKADEASQPTLVETFQQEMDAGFAAAVKESPALKR